MDATSLIEYEPQFPWERQADESNRSWAGFAVYRDLGLTDRSVSRVAEEFKAPSHTFVNDARKHKWVERARAYDNFVDRKKRDIDIQAVMDMRKRHIQIAMSLQGLAALALNRLIAAEKIAKAGKLLKPHDIKELAELGMRIERLNRGEPETVIENRSTMTWTDLVEKAFEDA